ncbi:MAG: hypothetical protein P9L99_19550 [Candidatus Lernaella stagnicola]|nr:hypothetical protein [Candidatus Lernaella stagnicola]
MKTKWGVWTIALLVLALIFVVACGTGGDGDQTSVGDDDATDDDTTPPLPNDDDDDDDTTDDDTAGDDDYDEATLWLVDGGAGRNGLDLLAEHEDLYLAAAKGRELFLFTSSGKGPWTEEFIARGAAKPALTRDSNGALHFAFQNPASETLFYASDRIERWEIVEVDIGFGAGRAIDIAVDGDNVPHILYAHEEILRDAYDDGDDIGWIRREVADIGVFSSDLSVTADFNGKLHLAFYDGNTNNLKYSARDETGWSEPVVVDPEFNVGHYPSIAVSGDDTVYIAYHNLSDTSLKLTVNDGGGWNPETVDANSGTGYFNSVAVAAGGEVGISYSACINDEGCQPAAAIGSPGSWNVMAIDDFTFDVLFHAAVFDGNGFGTAFYREIEAGYGELAFVRRTGDAWNTDVIAADVGLDTSLAASDSSIEAIACRDPRNGTAKLALPFEGEWATTVIDDTLDGGHRTSVAVDESGDYHVCYHREPGGALVYATNAGGLQSETVLDVGRDCSIAVGPDGTVYITSFHEDETDINLSTLGEEGWLTTSIAEGSTFGGDTALAVDQDGTLHVAFYFGEITFDVKYGNNATGTFLFEVVDNINDFGSRLSLDVDSIGRAHLAYALGNDFSEGTLKHASRALNGEWTLEDLDDDAGLWTALVMDDFDDVHIAFYRLSTGDLGYATNTSGDWEVRAIDTGGDAGDFASIGYTDDNNQVYIAYWAEGALYALRFPVGYDGWDDSR